MEFAMISSKNSVIPDGFKSITEDKVLPEIEPYKPRVLKTSLSNEQEAKLRAALNKVA